MKNIKDILNGKPFHGIILALIMCNAVLLGVEADPVWNNMYGDIFFELDRAILIILCIAVLLRVFVHNVDFFKYGWNIFDLIVVSVAVIGFISDVQFLKVLRVFMIFRIIEFFPSMQKLIDAMLHAFTGIVASIVILAIVFYTFSLAGYYLFKDIPGEDFTSIGLSFASLFQLMLFDDFGNITKPVVSQAPWAWLFFILFLFATAFSFINLLIAVFVDAINDVSARPEYKKKRK